MAAVQLLDHNLTFVHIPKSAGSSVVRWLTTQFQHQMIKGHPSLPMIKEQWAVGRTFAVVRNPWARIVSLYFYLKQYGFYWEDNQISSVEEFPTWEEFVDRRLDYEVNSWNTITTNQCKWIPDGVDYLFKAETLNTDFKTIQELLNSQVPLPHINTSEHNDYRSYYTEAQKIKIGQLFEQDIDLYKYTF
jgi:hypothetical protein